MCGIAGLLYTDGARACPEDRLRAMRDVMMHRGPDDSGVYLDRNLGLAHRRLSIIDLGTGHQPMSTPDGALTVVFNGEIYNYRELRRELEQRGHVFRTQSDTEVLLHLYRELGEDCASRLNGIFAFAIWDRARRLLFLARDHMGIKPLYYVSAPDAFVFASEAKVLFHSGHVTPAVEFDAVPEYLVFGYVAGERSLFRQVRTLLPGHVMTVADGAVHSRPYWSPLPRARRRIGEAQALEELDALLDSAVGMQMVSDVPLGTFCSGGVDSSLVSALCARRSGTPINTYSIGFHERDHDETEYARLVAQRYQTRHHELRVDQREFAELLPRMVWHNDEPLMFANSVQIYALSRLAKREVTVVLTGEGADELFAGYPRYLIPTLAGRLQRLPRPIRRLVSALARHSPEPRLRKLAAALDQPLNDIVLYNTARQSPGAARRTWDVWREPNYRTTLYDRFDPDASWLARSAWSDQHTYLVSILNRQDKMSMAASVESRVPVLDYRIVEFANQLPDRMRLNGSRTKYIWKRLAERYLPREVVYRRKSGFGVPLKAWLCATPGLGELARDALSAGRTPELAGFFPIDTLLTEHQQGRADHSDAIWSALNYALWKQAFALS